MTHAMINPTLEPPMLGIEKIEWLRRAASHFKKRVPDMSDEFCMNAAITEWESCEKDEPKDPESAVDNELESWDW